MDPPAQRAFPTVVRLVLFFAALVAIVGTIIVLIFIGRGIRRIIVPSENAQRRRFLHRAVLDRCPPHTYKRFRRAWRKRLEPQRGDGSIRNRRESRAEGPAFSCTYNETLRRKSNKQIQLLAVVVAITTRGLGPISARIC